MSDAHIDKIIDAILNSADCDGRLSQIELARAQIAVILAKVRKEAVKGYIENEDLKLAEVEREIYETKPEVSKNE